jgi:uncharacterized protein YigE (DUF2233 family)
MFAFFLGLIIGVRNYEILENNNKYVAVKINTEAYKSQLFLNKYNHESEIAVNTSFYWRKFPIGLFKDFENIPSILKYEFIRPTFVIDYNGNNYIMPILKGQILSDYVLACQAGPTLIDNNIIVLNKCSIEQKFQSDVLRRTSHTGIGITKLNKIIIIFGYNTSLGELANKFKSYGCKDAMNFDGGHSAFLKIGKNVYGNRNPFVGLQFLQNSLQ